MYAAYEALSDGLKRTLAGLRAVHSSRHVFGANANRGAEMKDRLGNAEAATQDAVHPMVITHPISGRKALFVNRGFTTHIEGWTAEKIKAAAGIPLPARRAPGILLPVHLGAGLAGVLGQPGDMALGRERLPRASAADAPDHAGGGGDFVRKKAVLFEKKNQKTFPRLRG